MFEGTTKITSTEKISQKSIEELNDLRNLISIKRKEVSELKREINKLEYKEKLFNDELVELIQDGHKVSRGKFLLRLKIVEKMPRLAWKQVFIKFVPNGKAKAEKLMNEREPEKLSFVEILLRE